MATTTTLNASVVSELLGTIALDGDSSGEVIVGYKSLRRVGPGQLTPHIDGTGWLSGDVALTTTPLEIRLEHATDPFGTGGDSAPQQGFVPNGTKIKAIRVHHVGGAGKIDVSMPATNGLAGFGWAVSQLIDRIGVDGEWVKVDPAGSAALDGAGGTNSRLVLTAVTGTATARITVLYGP